ncbi:MAG: hypothetical protein PHV44_03035 [Candidatus Omnitrophica bacterium]|nr:hypothetical protein [Candidatus Omnitrophota bacterium]
MGLTGVNKLCAQCINKCKQWREIKVISCPLFISTQRKKPDLNGRNFQGIPNKHRGMAEMPFFEAFSEERNKDMASEFMDTLQA